MSIMKMQMFAVLLLLGACPYLYGQVQVLPTAIDVQSSDVAPSFPLNLHDEFDVRVMRVNSFGQVQLKNAFGGNAPNFWQLGARDGGTLDIAYGTAGVGNGVVDISNALVTFTQTGEVGIGTDAPEDRLHIAGGDVQISDSSPRLDIIADGTNNSVLGFGDNGGGADATIVYDPGETQLTLSTISSSGNIILNRKVGVNETNDLEAQMTIKANSGTASTPVQLELRENNNSDFSRMRFSQFSVDGYWDIAGKAEPDGSLSGDPKINFFYYTGSSGSNIMTLDGDDKRVGIGDATPNSDFHLVQNSNNNTTTGIRMEDNDGTYWNVWVDNLDDYLFNNDGTSVAQIEDGTGNYQTFSDRRLKSNIKTMEPVLEEVKALRPVWYTFKADDKKKKTLGFIAQEVEEVLPDFVDTEKDYYALTYDYFGVLAIKAIQEQQELLEERDQRITELESRLARLEALVSQLAGNPEAPATMENGEAILFSDAKLFQNEPNPFNGQTLIRYQIPEKVSQAVIRITNTQGQVIQEVPIENRGAGQVELNTSLLSSGTYQYSLFLDGRLIDTRRMIRQK